MQALYFAYGSNMDGERLRSRTPSARALGAARLEGWRFTADKQGGDGSAKANLAPDPDACVWGVLYALDPGELAALDACERGYARIAVSVLRDGTAAPAQTYVSELRDPERALRPWYKARILAGAREHGLPEAWQRFLASLPAR